MKKLLLALLPLCLTASCAAGLVAVGAGVLIGAWIADDWSDSSGEITLRGTPEEVFDALVAEVNSRAGASEIQVVEAAMRVRWSEDGAAIQSFVKIMPDMPEFATLRVSAAELGIKGRSDLASGVADAVAKRLQ